MKQSHAFGRLPEAFRAKGTEICPRSPPSRSGPRVMPPCEKGRVSLKRTLERTHYAPVNNNHFDNLYCAIFRCILTPRKTESDVASDINTSLPLRSPGPAIYTEPNSFQHGCCRPYADSDNHRSSLQNGGPSQAYRFTATQVEIHVHGLEICGHGSASFVLCFVLQRRLITSTLLVANSASLSTWNCRAITSTIDSRASDQLVLPKNLPEAWQSRILCRDGLELDRERVKLSEGTAVYSTLISSSPCL